MWPFKKSAESQPAKPDSMHEAIEALRSFRDIGQSFNYLGRKCIVTSHWDLDPFLGAVATLRADYVDDHGVLHQVSFLRRELKALRAENCASGGPT